MCICEDCATTRPPFNGKKHDKKKKDKSSSSRNDNNNNNNKNVAPKCPICKKYFTRCIRIYTSGIILNENGSIQQMVA